MSFIAIFFASLIGSPHCAGMCGAFASISGANSNLRDSLLGITLYHFGRLNTYLLLGMLAAYLGKALNIGGELIGVANLAAILAGVLLIYWGIQGLRKDGSGILASASFGAVGALSAKVMSVADKLGGEKAKPYLLGLISTFLPCGWLYSFFAVAAAAGALHGALAGVWVMLAFWLGTLPILTSLGLASKYLVSIKGKLMPRLTYCLLVVGGLFSIFGRVGLDFSDPQIDEDYCGPSAANAETLVETSYQAEEVYRGSGILWGLDFIDSEKLIVTKRSGEAFLVNLASGSDEEIKGLPRVVSRGSGRTFRCCA